MAVSVSDINTKMTTAAAYIEAGDYDSALPVLLAAKALMAALPNTSGPAGGLQWRPEQIDTLITQCQAQQNRPASGSRGIGQSKVRYARADASDSY